jgi:hypothetical protein
MARLAIPAISMIVAMYRSRPCQGLHASIPVTFLSLSFAVLACGTSDSRGHLPDAPPEPDASIDASIDVPRMSRSRW